MAQKNATPSKEQQKVIKKAGENPLLWTVVQDQRQSMIIRHRITGQVKLIYK